MMHLWGIKALCAVEDFSVVEKRIASETADMDESDKVVLLE